jgi:VCBS repeat-containing protein
MFDSAFSTYLRTLASRLRASRPGKRTTRRPARPAVERLEDRTVPSTFQVNTTADTQDLNPGDGVALDAHGSTSLRAAFMEANAHPGADTIQLPAGTYALTLAPAGSDDAGSGDLNVTDMAGLSIVGAGPASTIIDARGLDRVFNVAAGAGLTFSGVTIRGGNSHSADGGGILNAGHLTLANCQVSGNTGNTQGGGVANESGASLTVSDSTFSGNNVYPNDFGSPLYGGAVANEGTATITNTLFRGNLAYASGGAIFNTGSLSVSGSTFDRNLAGTSFTLSVAASGTGGALFSTGGLANFDSSTFTGNRAGYGGALATLSGGNMNVTNSTFTGNRAEIDSTINPSRGGAIDGHSELHISGSTFNGNEAGGLGGRGGALYNASLMFLTNSTVSGNFAGKDGSTYNAPQGGGIYNAIGGSLTLTNDTVAYNNTRNAGLGGGVVNATGVTAGAITNIRNTIMALNGGPANNAPDVNGPFRSQGGNLIGNAVSSSGWTGSDQTGYGSSPIDPLLAPLANYGGPTATHALRPLSRALDRGVASGAPATDQRGLPRPARPAVDVGAYEFQPHVGADSIPVANADAYTLAMNRGLNVGVAQGVLANDTDADGDVLTAQLVTGPGGGTYSFTFRPDGTFFFQPLFNFTGTVTFSYRVTDGVAFSAPATVTLSVQGANVAPVAQNDSYSANKNGVLTVSAPGVLANDTDANGDALKAVLVTGPAHGSLILNADGSFTYTPTHNYTGPDSFTYRANDGLLSSNNVATVSLTVSDRAPVAADDAYSTYENAPLTVAGPGVLANDTDPDGDPLTATITVNPTHGVVTLNADGSFTYTPAANFYGADQFSYVAKDGVKSTPAVVTLTVNHVNQAPVAADDSYTVSKNNALTISGPGVLANDTDADNDPLTALLVSAPAHGTVTLNPDGSFTYTPAAGYTGSDSFTYKANDGQLDSNVAIVALTVQNDPPTAADDSYSTTQGSTLRVAAPGLLANDTDPNHDSLTVALVSGPAHGTLQLNPDGSFRYTPDFGFAGTDTFTYQASDGSAVSNLATVTITVPAITSPGVTFQTDPDNPNGLALVVRGTSGNDRIEIDSAGHTNRIEVLIRSRHYHFHDTYPASFTRIVVYGLEGDDTIRVADRVKLPALLFGGPGNDYLQAGGGPTVLVGGDGNDTLQGGSGRDVLIGGRGADYLRGGLGDSILIAGYTDFDPDARALSAVLDEWAASQGYAARLAGLGGLLNARTVHDDGVRDRVTGGRGRDGFLVNTACDRVRGVRIGETVTDTSGW